MPSSQKSCVHASVMQISFPHSLSAIFQCVFVIEFVCYCAIYDFFIVALVSSECTVLEMLNKVAFKLNIVCNLFY